MRVLVSPQVGFRWRGGPVSLLIMAVHGDPGEVVGSGSVVTGEATVLHEPAMVPSTIGVFDDGGALGRWVHPRRHAGCIRSNSK